MTRAHAVGYRCAALRADGVGVAAMPLSMGRLCRPLRGLVAAGGRHPNPALTRGAMILPPFGLMCSVWRGGGWQLGR